MDVVEIGSRAALAGLAPEWQGLLDAAEIWDLFQTFEWQTTWLEIFWQDRPLAFVLARRDGKLAALLPLLVADDRPGLCRPAVTAPFNPHVRRSGIAIGGDAAACLDAVLGNLRRRAGGARLLLRQMETRRSADVATAGRAHGLSSFPENCLTTPYLAMDGGQDAYLEQLPRQVRREMERKERKLAKAGRMEVSVAESPADIDAAIAAVLAVERASWKEGNGTSIANEPGLGDFYPLLMRRFGARGQCRTYVLRLDGRPIAHVLGFLIRGRYFAVKTAYDEAWRQLSPGAVLFWFVIRDGFERGWSELDFLGDTSRWKAELGNRSRTTVDLHVFPALDLGCQAARLIEEQIKPAARRVPGLPQLARRLRRRGVASSPGGGDGHT